MGTRDSRLGWASPGVVGMDKYTKIARLGEGTYGVVYKAQNSPRTQLPGPPWVKPESRSSPPTLPRSEPSSSPSRVWTQQATICCLSCSSPTQTPESRLQTPSSILSLSMPSTPPPTNLPPPEA